MKIGIEFDGVIANTPKLRSELARKLYNKSIPVGMFTKELVVGSGLLTPEQFQNLENKIFYSKGIGLTIEEVEKSVESIRKLLESGNGMIVFTDRGETGVDIIKEWFSSKGLNLEIETNGKTEGLDIYVSDDLERLKSLTGSIKILFLFTWDYNKDLNVGYSIWKIKSWVDLYKHIEMISK